MASLDQYLNERLARGRSYFSKEEALKALDLNPAAFTAAITRLIKKRRLANPRHGFYLILRPEDWAAGAPDPVRWIDPLMKYQGMDYRISLLRAAAFHGVRRVQENSDREHETISFINEKVFHTSRR